MLADGRSVSNIAVATNSLVRMPNSPNAMNETQWTTCVMFSNKRFPSPDSINVGAPVEIKGRLRSYKYTGADSQERFNTEVVVTDIILLPEGERLNPIVI